MANFSNEWDKIRENQPKITVLLKSRAKIDRLLAFMLAGNPVTGRTMIERFDIYSYRDAIYNLGQNPRNCGILSKTITSDNGIQHVVWWLDDFSEEFVQTRCPEAFR